jgi:hypothetical protein
MGVPCNRRVGKGNELGTEEQRAHPTRCRTTCRSRVLCVRCLWSAHAIEYKPELWSARAFHRSGSISDVDGKPGRCHSALSRGSRCSRSTAEIVVASGVLQRGATRSSKFVLNESEERVKSFDLDG